jgi:hypothetical protein
VLGQGGVSALVAGQVGSTLVQRHTNTVVEDLHGVLGHTKIHLLANQLVRDGVVVPAHLDMVVQADPGLLPGGQGIGVLG